MKTKNSTFEIVKKELRDVIRDKKTLISMILLPLLLSPIMFGFLLLMQDDMENADQSTYSTIGFAFETDDTLNTVIEELEIQKETGTKEELSTKLENGDIDGYVTLDGKEFTIYYMGQDTNGLNSLNLMYSLLENYKYIIQSHKLVSEGLTPDEIFNVYTVKEEEVSGKDFFTEYIISMVPTFIILSITVTAVMTAIDMTAGEKERGTLETLLTFPIKNDDIIMGKFLATTICTVVSSILGFISMYGTIYYLSGKLESFAEMEILSVQSFILSLIMFVIFSMLVSALSMVIASGAKSFKEAQNATQILQMLCLVPMFFSIMETEINTLFAIIPFLNINFLLNDIISGSLNMQYFIIMILSNLVFTFIILKSIIKLYKSDKILFS